MLPASRRADKKHILTIILANGGPIPIRIEGIYCGLKKIPKGIAVDLDDDPQPPFRLSEGDAKSWTVDRDELERDLFRALNRKQLLRDLEQPENWIPDDPSEITEPRREENLSLGAHVIAALRSSMLLLLDPFMNASSSFERYVLTNRRLTSLLYGESSNDLVIAVEDGLGNLYVEAIDQEASEWIDNTF